jgi:hypothetical protein
MNSNEFGGLDINFAQEIIDFSAINRVRNILKQN